MKELGNRIKHLRGNYTIEDAAVMIGLSRETLRKIEAGKKISLKSLKLIARGLKASPAEELELICTWLRAHAGAEANRLRIEPLAGNSSRLQLVGIDKAKEARAIFSGFTTKEQNALLLAMQRPEILRLIPHLNQLYKDVRSRAVAPQITFVRTVANKLGISPSRHERTSI